MKEKKVKVMYWSLFVAWMSLFFYHPMLEAQSYYFNQLKNFPSSYINCIAVDAYNVKWVGTEHGLIAFKNEQEFVLYDEANSSIRDAQINCISLDEDGNKWMGSYSKGLMRLDKNGKFHHYPFANAKILLITAIAISPENEIFVATVKDGVYLLVDNKLYPKWHVKNSKLPSNQINAITFDREHKQMFIATAKGLCEVYRKHWKLYPKLESVKDLQQIDDVWYASTLTHKGPKFWIKKEKKWEEIGQKGLFNYPFQFKEIVLGNQFIWVASDRGLLQFDGVKSRLFDTRYGLSKAISCIAIDQDSALWVGSIDKGLFKKGEKLRETAPKLPSISSHGIKVGAFLRLEHAIFLQSSSLFADTTAEKELQILLQYLQENPTTRVEIHGHTDNTGSQLKNWELSKQRTKVIVQYLIDYGIDSDRIIAKWHGENQPVVPNNSEQNKKLNRRVEVRIIQ